MTAMPLVVKGSRLFVGAGGGANIVYTGDSAITLFVPRAGDSLAAKRAAREAGCLEFGFREWYPERRREASSCP